MSLRLWFICCYQLYHQVFNIQSRSSRNISNAKFEKWKNKINRNYRIVSFVIRQCKHLQSPQSGTHLRVVRVVGRRARALALQHRHPCVSLPRYVRTVRTCAHECVRVRTYACSRVHATCVSCTGAYSYCTLCFVLVVRTWCEYAQFLL